MRYAILGALFGAAAITAAVAWCEPTGGGVPATEAQPLAGGGLIALVAGSDDQARQLILIDPQMRSMAVYQVQRSSGEVALKSVRNFRWDLEMLQFNSAPPLPQEIRSLLEGK